MSSAESSSAGRELLPIYPVKSVTHLSGSDTLTFLPERTFGRKEFDRIFFSYALSMIPGWQAALAHSLGMAAAGGEIQVVDFGQCESLPRWFKHGQFRWLDLFHVTPRANLAGFMKALASSRRAGIEWQSLYRGYAWRASLILP